MSVVVRCFGGFELVVGGRRVEKLGESERRLLALLCLNPGVAVQRRFIADRLWPGTDFGLSGNRLRTALVGLRKALDYDSALQSERNLITLDPETARIDVLRAVRAEKDARRATVDSAAERALTHLEAVTREELLPGWPDDWARCRASRRTWRWRSACRDVRPNHLTRHQPCNPFSWPPVRCHPETKTEVLAYA